LRQRYRGRQLDERADRYLDHIGQQVQRARQLVQDVLTFSNISAEPPLSRMELRPLWDEVSGEMSWPPDARLSCGPLPAVRANAGQLRQLFANLLGNAVKFRAVRPLEVSLRGWREDGPDGDCLIHFALRDNGVGIAPGHAEQVFVMFQRLHSRALTHGNGIGLAVCRKVIEQHGGRIWVEGEEVGTTVHFTLPAG
ncbi:MAG: sensor histidine kinase, partial [Deinococcus sp.]